MHQPSTNSYRKIQPRLPMNDITPVGELRGPTNSFKHDLPSPEFEANNRENSGFRVIPNGSESASTTTQKDQGNKRKRKSSILSRKTMSRISPRQHILQMPTKQRQSQSVNESNDDELEDELEEELEEEDGEESQTMRILVRMIAQSRSWLDGDGFLCNRLAMLWLMVRQEQEDEKDERALAIQERENERKEREFERQEREHAFIEGEHLRKEKECERNGILKKMEMYKIMSERKIIDSEEFSHISHSLLAQLNQINSKKRPASGPSRSSKVQK